MNELILPKNEYLIFSLKRGRATYINRPTILRLKVTYIQVKFISIYIQKTNVINNNSIYATNLTHDITGV